MMKKSAGDQYSDPYLSIAQKTWKFNFDLKIVELAAKNINYFNLVILSINHDVLDCDFLKEEIN